MPIAIARPWFSNIGGYLLLVKGLLRGEDVGGRKAASRRSYASQPFDELRTGASWPTTRLR
jgi:hypothetical protein